MAPPAPAEPASARPAPLRTGPADPPDRPLLLVVWWFASVLVAVVHNGLWTTPNVAFLSAIARNLGHNPFGARLAGDYLMTDVSLTALARVSAQDSPHALARLHLVVLVVAWAWVVWLARRRFGHATARTLTVVLAASPLVTVSMQWLGQPDPLTGACGIAMVLVRRRWSMFALGVLAGLTHPEQAVFMAAAAAVARRALPVAHDEQPRPPWWERIGRDALAAVGGVVAGRLLSELWFRLAGITIDHPRTDYLRYGLDGFVRHHTRQPLGLAWTLWGPLWLAMAALGVAALVSRRTGSAPGDDPSARRSWWVLAGVALVALVPVFVTLDETRVYAVITAPLLAAGSVLATRALPARWATRGAAGLLAVTAVLPGGFATGVTSWRGQLDTPAMVTWLADGSLPPGAPIRDGRPDVTAWLVSPFDFVIPRLPDG